MRDWLETYFGFTQGEIRGLCVFVVVMGILMVFPTVFSWFEISEKEFITAKDEKEIYEFLYVNQSTQKEGPSYSFSQDSHSDIDYFEFNPNHLSFQEGVRLGLTERQVRMIQNYVSKGGTFYKKEDFKKIYAITEEDYERLVPYISIPKVENSKSLSTTPKGSIRLEGIKKEEQIAQLYIELNTTDSIALQSLRGIGPVFASRIVRYRDNLGGFHNVSQLLSVYGMDEERFQGIANHVFVDTSLVKKININTVDYEQLRRHSLISSKQANAIIHYRKQHGSFTTINDLLKIALIDKDFLLKIAPYLIVSND